MSKLFSIFACVVFTLGIIVAAISQINQSIVREGGLQSRTVSWINNAVPNE